MSPIYGLMVYFLIGRSGLNKHTRERMDAVNRQVEALFQRDSAVEKGLEKESRSAYLQSSYIDKWAGFPLYQNTQTKYYSCGEEMFPDMLEALRGAKHFILSEKIKPYLLDFSSLILYICSIKKKTYNYSLKP